MEPLISTNCLPNTTSTSKAIERAMTEATKCEGCTGRPCQKENAEDRYWRAVIRDDDPVWERCQYYKKPQKKSEDNQPLYALGAIFDNSVAKEIGETILAEMQAVRKPQYEARYGVKLTDEQYSALDKVLVRLPECDTCNGNYCNKTVGQYQRPKVTLDGDTLKAEFELCDVWKRVACKEKCRQSGIPARYIGKTFDDYEVTNVNKKAVDSAKWFVRAQRDKGLYFYGGTGTGKTFLASLTAQEIVRQMRNVIFGDVPELLKRLKETFNDQTLSTDQILNRYIKTPLLILDDFGAGQITDWSVGILYQIINDRYNANKPVIVTSNYDLDGLGERLIIRDSKGKVIDAFSAERIVSRLKEMCYQTFLGTKDRRG